MKNYDDLNHLSALGTHRLHNKTLRVLQGKVFKDGSKGSRKVQLTEPEKQNQWVAPVNYAGKKCTGKYGKINSAIVGAIGTDVDQNVPREIKERAKQLKAEKKAVDSGDKIYIQAPDGSRHAVCLHEVYPV